MHLLALDKEFLGDGIVITLPQSIGVMSDVAGGDVLAIASPSKQGVAYLMVINPIPASMPIIKNSCQNSRHLSSCQPRISIR